ncbi:hypothetical protein IW262DRAFT_758757 [Armillaria fumosa]|nr:hypothetical protein IW262DRAFT_758757 [Armillaria fumosa]
MTRVPVELYRCIVECVTDRKTLLSLLLTNQVLHDEAERVLYRDVSNIFDIESYTLLLQRFISCPRVARLLLPIALRALTNLKMLVFRSIGGSLEAYIPSDCACQLEYLDWQCTSESKGSELSHFLPTQHRLRTIQNLQWRSDYEVPPPTSLPALSTLSGNYDAIKALLPGRTVTSLHWISDVKDVRSPDVSELVEPLGNLETFRLGGHHERPSLALLADHLSNVKVLELFGVKPGDLECIDKLPHLEELKVSTQWGSSADGPISPRDARTVVSKLFDATPTLRTPLSQKFSLLRSI